MVVAVGSHDIKCHSPKRLFQGGISELQPFNGQEKLAVIVACFLLVIQMRQRAERLQMVLLVAIPVKTQCHEMRPAILLKQAA